MSNQTVQTLGKFSVTELDSYQLFSQVIAQELLGSINAKLSQSQPDQSQSDHVKSNAEVPRFNIGLPTGSTPIGIYSELNQLLSLDQAQSINYFGLDEYIAVAEADSYYRFLCDHFYEPNAIAIEYRHRPEKYLRYPGNYDCIIDTYGGMDLVLLGLGNNGHIAFNEPGSEVSSVTREIELSASTKQANRRFFEGASVPTHAVTMGIDTILKARKIILAVHGESKRKALLDAFTGPITSEVPASFLQLRDDVTIFTDFSLDFGC